MRGISVEPTRSNGLLCGMAVCVAYSRGTHSVLYGSASVGRALHAVAVWSGHAEVRRCIAPRRAVACAGYVRERRYFAALTGNSTGYSPWSVAPCRVDANLPPAVRAAWMGLRRALQRRLAHSGVWLVWCCAIVYSPVLHGYSRNTVSRTEVPRRRGVDVSHSVAQNTAPRGAFVHPGI